MCRRGLKMQDFLLDVWHASRRVGAVRHPPYRRSDRAWPTGSSCSPRGRGGSRRSCRSTCRGRAICSHREAEALRRELTELLRDEVDRAFAEQEALSPRPTYPRSDRRGEHACIADPQPRHHHPRAGSSSLERDRGRRRAAGGRRHHRDRHLRRSAPQAPDRAGDRHGQRDPAARLRQRPPPCRADAGAARLARHAAGAVVRHPHGDPQPQPLSRHALFGLRDDRLRHHHGAAHPWLDARASSPR